MVFYRCYTNVNNNQYKSNNMNGDLNNIIEVVNEVFEVDIRVRTHKRNVILGKKTYMHIAYKLGLYTLSEIGRHVGNTHATAYNHINSFEYILVADPILRRKLESCNLKIHSMFNIENPNYRDLVFMHWKELTNKQRSKIADMTKEYYDSNKLKEEAYV